MPELVWDQVGDRVYETGLDKAVLYLPDGTGVPWNGLVSVIEKFEMERSPVYYDGMKVSELLTLGTFEATMKAVTYPEEFIEIEGMAALRPGALVADQNPGVFGLCYRTLVGNDLEPEAGYKINIVYNLTAIPSEKTYATISNDPSLVEFEWDIYAIPEEIPGFRPSAHIVIDSRDFDPWLMEDIEKKLYGSEFTEPELLPLPELVDYISNWYRWKVTDLGDGTYKLESGRGDALIFSGSNLEIFQALGVYVIDHGDGTFTVYDTYDISDIPQIKIIDNGDGTWTATTQFDALIAVDAEGYFNIFNANAVFVAADKYNLSDTTE